MRPDCQNCSLYGRPRIQPRGKRSRPLIAFVGEAPGRQEAEQGIPFVGMSGQLLSGIIAHVGIDEAECYFTNTCMCHPPQDRDPAADEIRACWPRLEHELKTVQPKLIVALGAVATKALFPGVRRIGEVRGKLAETRIGIAGIPFNHPAAALYPGGEVLFPSLIRDMQKAYRYVTEANPPFAEHSTQVIFVQSNEIAAQVVARLRAVEHLSYDWETTGVNPNVAVGFCLGMSWKPGTAVVWPAQMVRKYRKELTEIFSRPDLVCIAFNAMFDAKFNERIGLPARVDEDPMLMHYMLDERPQHRSLESLTIDYLDAPPYESEMLTKYECTKSEMVKKVPVEVIYEYCGRDADYALRLYLLFKDLLKDKPGPQRAYREVVIPAAQAFADIQHYGIWVNRDRLESVTTEHENILKNLQTELVELVGDENFNPNSHQQVQGFIWDYLKLKEPELYGRKPRSVDKTTREALLARYPDHPFIVALDKYKATYTNLSRYLWPLTKVIDLDGRIRSSYRLDRTETGRLSTTDPPIHQIPRESNIRSIFGAPPGYVLIQADYSQVEIRMAAHYADDWRLISLLKSGVDFHTKMAAEAFRAPVDKVTKEQRQAAKAVSFGLLYLMGDKKLADSTGLPPEEAVAFVQSYKALMPDVQKWIEKTKRQVRERRYVESIFGRRRRFPLIINQNLAKLQREAVNMPVQSAASDLTLCSVVKLHEIFKQEYPEARIVIMVHDSIIVECPAPLAEEIGFLMIKIMSDPPFETNVPFPVEVKIGECWGEGEILTG